MKRIPKNKKEKGAGELLLDFPEDQYHAQTGHGSGLWITRSMIRDYIESPAGYWARYIQRDEEAARPPLQAYRSGRLTTFAEGHLAEWIFCGIAPGIDHEYNIRPRYVETDKTKKPTLWRDHLKQAKVIQRRHDERGCMLVDEDSIRRIDYYIEFACRHPLIKQLRRAVMDGEAILQPTFRWVDEATGLRLQSRPDILWNGVVWDIKTNSKPIERFATTAEDLGYDMQDVICMEGAARHYQLESARTHFVIADKYYPFGGHIRGLCDSQRRNAAKMIRKALAGIAAKEWRTVEEKEGVPLIAEPKDWDLQRWDGA